MTIPDYDHDLDDERFVIVGMTSKRSLLVVVHTISGDRIRLISARPATKHERRKYEQAYHYAPSPSDEGRVRLF